jgi:hypothetical protein
MPARFELQRALSLESPKGVERIVSSLFAPPARTHAALVLTLPIEAVVRGAATRPTPSTSP